MHLIPNHYFFLNVDINFFLFELKRYKRSKKGHFIFIKKMNLLWQQKVCIPKRHTWAMIRAMTAAHTVYPTGPPHRWMPKQGVCEAGPSRPINLPTQPNVQEIPEGCHVGLKHIRKLEKTLPPANAFQQMECKAKSMMPSWQKASYLGRLHPQMQDHQGTSDNDRHHQGTRPTRVTDTMYGWNTAGLPSWDIQIRGHKKTYTNKA